MIAVKKIILLLLVIFTVLTVQSKVIYVKTSGNNTTGTSWETAYQTIPFALSKATAGDDIYVAAGTYSDAWGNLKAGVNLYGGFSGTAESTVEGRAKASSGNSYDFADETIITITNGQVINHTVSFADDKSLYIDGFNFKGSTNNATIMVVRGGVTFRNCKFTDNEANVAATPPGTNNLILANVTALTGADTHFAIVNCLFDGNTNHQNQNILGITTAADGCYAVIEGTVFKNNIVDCATATNANMLMCASGVGLTSIRNCRIYNNTIKNAVLRADKASEIVNCLIYNNTCGTNNVLLGGKMYNSLVVNNTSRFCFNDNAAELYNTVVVGNAVNSLSFNANISNPTAGNTAVEAKIPTLGTYKDMLLLEDLATAGFVRPTTFKGVATSDELMAEYAQCDWKLNTSSPLINTGLSSWFKLSGYGQESVNNKDFTGSHVRYYADSEATDINAYEADKWELTINLGEGGTMPVNQNGYYVSGQVLELKVAPEAGYRVKEWTDNEGNVLATTANLTYPMPAADTQLKVSFYADSKQYQLTVRVGEGGQLKNDPSGLYNPDQVIRLGAMPNIGYRFKNWTDASGVILSTDIDYSYTMPEAESTVTANFELKADDAAAGHAFDFEGLGINNQWQAIDGTLGISEDRSQSGTQSMCWTVPAQQKSVLKVNLATPYTIGTMTNTCYFNLYNKKALRGGTLDVKFLNSDGAVLCSTTLVMDFVGWREFERIYQLEFKEKPLAFKKIATVEFTLNNPAIAGDISLFFDRVNLETTVSSVRFQSDWNAKDVAIFGSPGLLSDYAHTLDETLPYTEPTGNELAGLEIVKGRYVFEPRQGDVVSARSFVAALNLTRNSDGTIKAPATALRGAAMLTNENILTTCTRIETLGFAAKTSDTDKQLLNDYLDYLIDQGLMYRTTPPSSSDYALVREMGQTLTRCVTACQTERQSRELAKIAQWIMMNGHIYRANYIKSQNSDIIYNFIQFYTAIATQIQDKAVAVRDVKAMKRYLERGVEITPGGYDLLKPDGTGFHHSTHYPNYMYAYQGWIGVLKNLSGTTFRISQEGYEGFKKAAMAMCMLSTRGATNHIANSLNGRNPFASGNKLQLGKTNMADLSAVGGDVYGKQSDEELDAFNAYLFEIGSASTQYDGYYAFNWSPTGVYRYGSWVATMRAPTAKFWGSEIYDKRNRFGRYQAHGTLEILYNDKTSPAGYLPSRDQGGWDWNVVPGGTTVHYTNWTEMTPNKNLTQRFDQYAKTKNFAGALPFEGNGIFASDFDQMDTWSGQCFSPTGLAFKKSVFAFEGKLISLGSNVTSTATPANTGVTATNLFQSYAPAAGPNVNGTVISQSAATTDYDAGKWLITPEGTGYYVPQGNDKISVFFGEQRGPKDDGSDLSSPAKAIAAKAYINHGVKPTDKKYHFIVVPDASASDMQAIAGKVGEVGGELYMINSQDEMLHSLTYKPLNITAYAFFEAKAGLAFGRVLAAGSEMLLTEKMVSDKHLSFGVCNPDLHPESDGGDGWYATPTHTSITVKGVWYLASKTDENVIVANDGTNTTVTLTLKDGAPVYFELDYSPVGLTSTTENSVQVWAEEGSCRVAADRLTEVTVFSTAGMSVAISAKACNHTISLPRGIYMIRLQNDKGVKTSKVVIQ